MGPAAAGELNRFVVWLALPALVFHILANTSWQQLWQPGFVGTFLIACLSVFAFVLIQRLVSGKPLVDASVDGIAASYPNTAYMGFPLCLLLFGEEALLPTSIASIIVVCVLFSLAIILIETGLQAERKPHKLLLKVMAALVKNPLIVAPAAGALVSICGFKVPASADTFLKLLGAAASPCALVSLGLFLAEKREKSSTEQVSNTHASFTKVPLFLTTCKLLLQPVLTWWLGAKIFGLSTSMLHIAVVLAALPTGTGPYMLAEFYRRDALVTSRTILMSTVLSLITLTILMILMR